MIRWTRFIAILLCFALLANDGARAAFCASTGRPTAVQTHFASEGLSLPSVSSHRWLLKAVVSLVSLGLYAQTKQPIISMQEALKQNRQDLFSMAIQRPGAPADLESILESHKPAQEADEWEARAVRWIGLNTTPEARQNVRLVARLLYRTTSEPALLNDLIDTLLKLATADAVQNPSLENEIAKTLVVDIRKKPGLKDSGELSTVISHAEALRNSSGLTIQAQVNFLEGFLRLEGIELVHRQIEPLIPQAKDATPANQTNTHQLSWYKRLWKRIRYPAKIVGILVALFLIIRFGPWVIERFIFPNPPSTGNFLFLALFEDKPGESSFIEKWGAWGADHPWKFGLVVAAGIIGTASIVIGLALYRIIKQDKENLSPLLASIAHSLRQIRLPLGMPERGWHLDTSSREFLNPLHGITEQMIGPLFTTISGLEMDQVAAQPHLENALRKLGNIQFYYQALLRAPEDSFDINVVAQLGLPTAKDNSQAFDLLYSPYRQGASLELRTTLNHLNSHQAQINLLRELLNYPRIKFAWSWRHMHQSFMRLLKHHRLLNNPALFHSVAGKAA